MNILIGLQMFQHTAARRRLVVSTDDLNSGRKRFNTQPPEGGWSSSTIILYPTGCFNTQPPEGGWPETEAAADFWAVSTHSRPKAAGARSEIFYIGGTVSTHSRPKAAGASLKSLAPSGFAAPISLSSQEKREREYNTAFSVTPVFAIS